MVQPLETRLTTQNIDIKVLNLKVHTISFLNHEALSSHAVYG